MLRSQFPCNCVHTLTSLVNLTMAYYAETCWINTGVNNCHVWPDLGDSYEGNLIWTPCRTTSHLIHVCEVINRWSNYSADWQLVITPYSHKTVISYKLHHILPTIPANLYHSRFCTVIETNLCTVYDTNCSLSGQVTTATLQLSCPCIHRLLNATFSYLWANFCLLSG